MARDYGVKLGSALFTMVEPRPGHELDYNRWYERDHFYAGCMIGPWLFAGRRWVSTKPLQALRYPSDSPIAQPLDLGKYIAVYWIHDDHHDDHNAWAVTQVNHLHATGRMYIDRDHISTAMYRYEGGVFRDDPEQGGVPAEIALDHPYQGLVCMWTECAPGVSLSEFTTTWQREIAPSVVGGPVGMGLSWTLIPLSDDRPADVPQVPGLDTRMLHSFFLNVDPREVWTDRFAELGARVSATGKGRVTLAAPFIPTIPGTDTYVDQIR